MSAELAYYISSYGCIAIFLFVFLQEVGVPNPIPNEFILLFSGYWASSGLLFFPKVWLFCVVADLLAATILYVVFYFFGSFILYKKLRWIPFVYRALERQSERIRNQGVSSIVVGRLSPFIRGYVAAICGVLHIHPQKYVFIILFTSTVWATFYLSLGYWLAPYWNCVMDKFSMFQYVMVGLLLAVILFMVWKYVKKNHENKRSNV